MLSSVIEVIALDLDAASDDGHTLTPQGQKMLAHAMRGWSERVAELEAKSSVKTIPVRRVFEPRIVGGKDMSNSENGDRHVAG